MLLAQLPFSALLKDGLAHLLLAELQDFRGSVM